MPEPEVLPRAAALGVLLFWAESSAAAADRVEVEEMREAFVLAMDATLGVDPFSDEAAAETVPSSVLWPYLLRSRITRTLVDVDATRLDDAADGVLPATVLQHMLTGAQTILTMAAPDTGEPSREQMGEKLHAVRDVLRTVDGELKAAQRRVNAARRQLRNLGVDL
ncbi:hypothetical protein [Streptomyces sp. WM6378]|uniref:hypothetical protein n=1 Tax=Streptomyces sp. WM6378 TaxID=1415557 RepID=UPI0006AF981B|nr:hypothetical protein [Streptomyces sp. WM6378]KOU43186.1 hypothetical protein ADK54_17825 [Streptomyces sp. WM6378]